MSKKTQLVPARFLGPKTEINDLPPEILSMIFDRCCEDGPDFVSQMFARGVLCEVCPYWRDVVVRCTNVWRRLDFRYYPELMEFVIENKLFARCSEIVFRSDILEWVLVRAIAKEKEPVRCTDLAMYGYRSKDFLTAFPSLRNLTSIELRHVRLCEEFFEHATESCPNVTTVRMTEVYGRSYNYHIPFSWLRPLFSKWRLERLWLTNLHLDRVDEVGRLVANFCTLTELGLERVYANYMLYGFEVEIPVRRLLERNRNLKALSLVECSLVDFPKTFTPYLPDLERCTLLLKETGDVYPRMIRNSPRIKHLSLGDRHVNFNTNCSYDIMKELKKIRGAKTICVNMTGSTVDASEVGDFFSNQRETVETLFFSVHGLSCDFDETALEGLKGATKLRELELMLWEKKPDVRLLLDLEKTCPRLNRVSLRYGRHSITLIPAMKYCHDFAIRKNCEPTCTSKHDGMPAVEL